MTRFRKWKPMPSAPMSASPASHAFHPVPANPDRSGFQKPFPFQRTLHLIREIHPHMPSCNHIRQQVSGTMHPAYPPPSGKPAPPPHPSFAKGTARYSEFVRPNTVICGQSGSLPSNRSANPAFRTMITSESQIAVPPAYIPRPCRRKPR